MLRSIPFQAPVDYSHIQRAHSLPYRAHCPRVNITPACSISVAQHSTDEIGRSYFSSAVVPDFG